MKKLILLCLFFISAFSSSSAENYWHSGVSPYANVRCRGFVGYSGLWGGWVSADLIPPAYSEYGASTKAYYTWVKVQWEVNGVAFPVQTNYYPDPPNTPDPMTPNPGKADTKEPINVISGNNHFALTEISIPAPGIPLVFSRYYNSAETNDSVLGKGWQHTYDWSLAIKSNIVGVTSDDARIYTFSKNSNGVYSASFDNNWQLSGLTNEAYTLLLPSGLAYRFDTNGALQAVSDNWSNTVSLVYSNGLLTSAQHSKGQSLDFFYSNGLLSTVMAATNLSVAFTYSTNGVLTNAVRQASSERYAETYRYSAALLLTQRVDAAGSDYHYTYNAGTGRATGMYLTDNRWYEHSVEYSNSLSRVIYTRGGDELVHDYVYDNGIKRVLEERFNTGTGKVTYAYGIDRNVARETTYDANTNRWTQIYRLYDAWHNVTNEAFGLGAAPTNITKYTWHPQWQTLTSVTDPEGFKKEYEYINGAIAKARIYLSSNTTAETKYSYTTNGLLSAVTNANGHATAFTYDTRGYPESVIPQAGPTVTFGYDSLGHLTNSAIGGRQTGYTVNPLGWVERIDYADSLYETFQYNGLGKVTNQVDRAQRVASYAYAPGGKLTAVRRQLGGTNVTVSYDFDQQFNTLAIRDELNRPVESYALDPQDRPTIVTNLEGQTMSIRYLVGDFVDSITRFDNTVVSNQYNGDGRLTAVSYSDQTNRYTYLRNGLVQTLENSEGMISNSWNMASWLTKAVSSASSVTSVVDYSYDPVGNVTNSAVDFGGSRSVATAYQYDQAERLTSLLAETQSTQRFVYAYNANNGLVASVSNANLRAEYEYDILDRITRIDWKDRWGATILSFDYQYNAAGMITNRILTGGSGSVTTAYQYDDLDRLISVDDASSFVQYSYDAAGNRQTKTGADYTVAYALGDGNRLASWSATSTNDFLSKRTVRVEGYTSEPIGTDNRWGQLYVSNSVAVVPEIDGTNFWIDSFVTGLGTQQVIAAIRDPAGNVGYATNQIFLSVVTNAQYGYSAAGCLTNISYSGAEYSDTKALEWNGQYQLTSVSSSAFAVEYSYDVLGRRVGCSVGSASQTNVEHYVYDGNQVVADLDGNGTLLRTYVWGTGIDNLLAFTDHATSNTYYAIKDHLNSIYAFVDNSGSVVESYEYDAWGRVLDIKDASGNSIANHQSAIGNRYLWQGREYDSTTGLYYFRARWYDPVVGRFIQKDPLGIAGGLNQFIALDNSPPNLTDPFGLQTVLLTPWWATLLEEPPVVPRLLLEPPKPGTPPNGMVENLNRPGSYGTGNGSGFKELWRLDKGTPGKPGWGGKDHLHFNDEKPHLPLDTPWGMGPDGKLVPQPGIPLMPQTRPLRCPNLA